LQEHALRDSLTDLAARHDALRASFNLHSQTQQFSAPTAIDLPVINLSGIAPEFQRARYDELLAADAREPFDLTRPPLLRLKLIRYQPDRHVLVFTAHHIVCDGWSINVLLDELSHLYNSRITGVPSDLSPLLTFREYALAQEAHFLGAEGAANEDFWVKQFAELPPLLSLPLDRPRPAFKSFDGATYRKKIDAATYKKIKQAGAKQKCTLFVTLMAGFHGLLSRLTGQDDIVVGIPAAGQSLVENKVLVGHCVNFVPLRGRLTGDPTVAQFLDQMRKTLFDAYDHQNYTYGRLVRKLSIPRDPSRLPLLEVQFNLEKVGTGLAFSGLTVDVDSNPKAFVNFDLFLNIVEGDDGLTLDLDYNTALMDESTVARWLDCYEALLVSMAEDASQHVSRLALLSEAERNRVLCAANQTAADYPADKCVNGLFEEAVARTPKSIALEFEGQCLTYAQLNARANQLARHLTKVGVQPGDLVGAYMERSVEMIVALLATWKAGAAYVPLDPTFPRERLVFVFEDTQVPIVLTQARLEHDLPSADTRVVCVDRDWPTIDREDASDLDVPQDSSRVAYTIYTSGSTGKPKGVEVTQRNVVNLLQSMAKKPGLKATDVLVAVTTISFDIAALELFLPLITGAKLVLASRMVASDGLKLLDLIARSGATILQATPITFRLLLEAGWKGKPQFTVLCGGEALPRELANQILACGVPLWNMYGPTETTIWSAASQVSVADGPVPVGPPIDNTQFYVLDVNQQPVAFGVMGELYIGGDGVARGYYKRPELTREKFLPDPFRTSKPARMYRTGDLVRRLPDGHFEFLGRMDGQIKLRGFRIELGEIESVLAMHSSVQQATVLLREDTPGDKRLVAYLVAQPDTTPDTAAIRSFLLTKLPDYMVPVGFITLPSLPLTPNGKIDRRALPVPEWGSQSHGTPFVEATTPDEKTMAGIWAEVLRVKKVGIHDNLFDLGADSLHVFQITSRAGAAGLSITPRMILEQRTISAVLAAMQKSDAPAKSQPTIRPVARKRYSTAQGIEIK
jgi:amino acid adenylation domain-containing protein